MDDRKRTSSRDGEDGLTASGRKGIIAGVVRINHVSDEEDEGKAYRRGTREPDVMVLMMMKGRKRQQKGDNSTATIYYQEETAQIHSIWLKNGDSVDTNYARDISPDTRMKI